MKDRLKFVCFARNQLTTKMAARRASAAARRGSRLLRRLSSVFFDSQASKTPSFQLVPIVRDRFLEEVKENPGWFDEVDVQRIKNNEFLVRRFLECNKNDQDDALEQLVDAMKWRKEFGVNER